MVTTAMRKAVFADMAHKRALSLTPARRSEIARNAVLTRWRKYRAAKRRKGKG